MRRHSNPDNIPATRQTSVWQTCFHPLVVLDQRTNDISLSSKKYLVFDKNDHIVIFAAVDQIGLDLLAARWKLVDD